VATNEGHSRGYEWREGGRGDTGPVRDNRCKKKKKKKQAYGSADVERRVYSMAIMYSVKGHIAVAQGVWSRTTKRKGRAALARGGRNVDSLFVPLDEPSSDHRVSQA